jgi:hypothetical protein
VATAVPGRRLATALAALALAGSSALLGGVAWADPTPAPSSTADATPSGEPVAPPDVPEAPATQPSIGSWIIGGTLLEGTTSTHAGAKPAAPKPVAATGTRATTRSTATTHTAGTSAAATAPDGATALPFTGGHVGALLPTGVAMLAAGAALMYATRPRRALI